MSYLVLARKYRSATFEEVIGQEPVARTLSNAIRDDRVAHAYLFAGARGVGKTTTARILAKCLNCLSVDAPTTDPCNKCEACLATARGDDIDVVEIDGASNRGIDEIRELRANAIYRPARGRYKIYYIDEVHMLTREAFNALLKTLEEPPGHVKFIFATTEPQKVPATIVSRCQRFDFADIPTSMIANHLKAVCKKEKITADDEALFRIARAAAGSMRDGLSLLDQMIASDAEITPQAVVSVLGAPPDQQVLTIVEAIAAGDSAAALGELDKVLRGSVTLGSAANAIGDAFRNMMLAATCGPDSDLIELPDTQKQATADLAGRFSLPALVQAVSVLQNAAWRMRGSSLSRALLEASVVRLAEADKFVDPESIAERLEKLASGQKKNSQPTGSSRSGSSVKAPVGGRHADDGRYVAADPQREAPQVRWEPQWLESNWRMLLEALLARGEKQIAGAIRPARLIELKDDTVILGFDGNHEALRQRCAGALSGPISSALSRLAGRDVKCEFVSDSPQGGAASGGRAFGGLSTDEKNGIVKDPHVRKVLSMFDADVVDITRKSDLPTGGANRSEQTDVENENDTL